EADLENTISATSAPRRELALENALQREFGEGDRECQAEVGEDLRVDLRDDADRLVCHCHHCCAAGDETRITPEATVFGLPTKLSHQRIAGAADSGITAFGAGFGESDDAKLAGAGFGLVIESDRVVDFKKPLRHWPATILTQCFEQARYELIADEVIGFQL